MGIKIDKTNKWKWIAITTMIILAGMGIYNALPNAKEYCMSQDYCLSESYCMSYPKSEEEYMKLGGENVLNNIVSQIKLRESAITIDTGNNGILICDVVE